MSAIAEGRRPEPEVEAASRGPRDRSHDQANAAFAGFVLVSVGIAFFLLQSGSLRGLNAAGVLLIAVGMAFIVDAGFRHASGHGAAVRNNRLVIGAIILAVGAVATTDLDAWPLILVLVGGLLVGRAVVNARLVP